MKVCPTYPCCLKTKGWKWGLMFNSLPQLPAAVALNKWVNTKELTVILILLKLCAIGLSPDCTNAKNLSEMPAPKSLREQVKYGVKMELLAFNKHGWVSDPRWRVQTRLVLTRSSPGQRGLAKSGCCLIWFLFRRIGRVNLSSMGWLGWVLLLWLK